MNEFWLSCNLRPLLGAERRRGDNHMGLGP